MGRRAPPVTPTACLRHDAGALRRGKSRCRRGCVAPEIARPTRSTAPTPGRAPAPCALPSLGATQATSHGPCDQHGPAPFGGLTPRYWRLRHFGPAPAPGWARRDAAADAIYGPIPACCAATCSVAMAPARGAGRAPGHAGRMARSGWPMALRVPAQGSFGCMDRGRSWLRPFAADSIHWIESETPPTPGQAPDNGYGMRQGPRRPSVAPAPSGHWPLAPCQAWDERMPHAFGTGDQPGPAPAPPPGRAPSQRCKKRCRWGWSAP
jgi:hypothetical protein